VTITLSRWEPKSPIYQNAGAATFSGSLISLNAATAGYVVLTQYELSGVVPGQDVAVSLQLTVPATKTGATYRVDYVARSAAGTDLLVTAAAVTVAPGESKELSASLVMPGGATYISAYFGLVSGAASNRQVSVDSVFVSKAYPDELVGGSVSRDLARTDATTPAGGLALIQGAIGPRAGTLTFLCSTWAQVAALEALYRTGSAYLPAQGALPAFDHYATGRIRATLERALAGRPAKWLVTVDYREAS